MRRAFTAILLTALACLAVLATGGHAARDITTGSLAATSQEIVVFETPTCVYCQLFRRDVLPGYQKSARAAELPIRFVDTNETDISKLPLAAPLSTLPTAVILREGREIGRIAGYTGPDTFHAVIAHLLGPARQ